MVWLDWSRKSLVFAYREKRRGRGVRGCCRWYRICAITGIVSLNPNHIRCTCNASTGHTNFGVLLIPLVSRLVCGCGTEVCALLLLSQAAAHSGERSLGAP